MASDPNGLAGAEHSARIGMAVAAGLLGLVDPVL
jgi:hypothetical protein